MNALTTTLLDLNRTLHNVRKSVDGPTVADLVAFKPEVARWLRGIYVHPNIGMDQPVKYLKANLENRYRNNLSRRNADVSLLRLCRDVLAAIEAFGIQLDREWA